MFGDQGQAQHAGQRWWRGKRRRRRRRVTQACQGFGDCVEHAIGEMAGEGVQLAALGHQVRLLHGIARAIRVVQQRLFQRFNGQDQRRGQGLPAEADQRAQQFAHPRRQVGCSQAGFVGRGWGKDS